MTQQNAEILQQNYEAIDPNVAQKKASNPVESVWVGASAGTGKTKVLTDRVLRLLLPRDDGQPATPVNRILCLTYTKAAASEMSLRINKILGEWAVLEINLLTQKLQETLGTVPSIYQIEAAQKLFAQVMETLGGLQIMTIHSFCQSVLGRFPLEAAISPNFNLLEETKALEMLQQAKYMTIDKAQSKEYVGSPLAIALGHIGNEIDEEAFDDLVQNIASERKQLSQMLSTRSPEHIYAALCSQYDIHQNAKASDVIDLLCDDNLFNLHGLQMTAEAMLREGSITSIKDGQVISSWVKSNASQRIKLFDKYRSIFFNKNGELRRGKFPLKGTIEIYPPSLDILQQEQERLVFAQEKIKRIKSANLTRDVIILAQEIIKNYEIIKKQHGSLDFDDLILRTLDLLRKDDASGQSHAGAWIMYKLDQGLDHILLDEAQDTNPEHWQIIETLCDEFFQGKTARDEINRTVFVVGDVKQSIYSFQRAAPEEFLRMQGLFRKKIENADKTSRNIDLDISFRTTQSVLRVVDGVFADKMMNLAVGGGIIRHIPYRSGQAGCVEIWPLNKSDDKEKIDLWSPKLEVKKQQNASSRLANQIAQTIKSWIGKEVLHSASRAVEAEDIMILVRSRTAFVDQLVRSLKLADIPVSGVDRMQLGEQLVVQDMLSMARFVLLPEDDLNLACILKSPFLGWTEDDLFALCYNRKGSLWSQILLKNHTTLNCEKLEIARSYLHQIREIGINKGVYEFFSVLLQSPCPGDSHSGLKAIKTRLGEDAVDPLEELMNVSLAFSNTEIDSLQLFVEKQESKDIAIKRELEEKSGKVRIMTVHGSKGLQAPIVILPDIIKKAQGRKNARFLWPNKTGLNVPLWSPRKDDDPSYYRSYYEQVRELAEQEEARLLYVAMTRAEDRLYVAGSLSNGGKIENSWYERVFKVIEKDNMVIKMPNGSMRIENQQTTEPDKVRKISIEQKCGKALPEWIARQAPLEPALPMSLVPSKLSLMEQEAKLPSLSPLLANKKYRFRRGILTHKLLQFLPEISNEAREGAALHFLQKNAADLPQELRDEITKEIFKILNNPKYISFFNKGSKAEVPVTGLMTDNRIVNGQIDRLVVGESEIWILDYKTNRPPPTDPKEIPKAYRAQMQAYREILTSIYPKHKINCALLWTDGPILMIVD